jgi:hypothetical protein
MSTHIFIETADNFEKSSPPPALLQQPADRARDGPDWGLRFSCSGRFEFEPLTDELRGFGQCAGA